MWSKSYFVVETIERVDRTDLDCDEVNDIPFLRVDFCFGIIVYTKGLTKCSSGTTNNVSILATSWLINISDSSSPNSTRRGMVVIAGRMRM